MDGIDVWESLSRDRASPRKVLLHNINTFKGISAVRMGQWKLIQGKSSALYL